MVGPAQRRLGHAEVVPAEPHEDRLSEDDARIGVVGEPVDEECGPIGPAGGVGHHGCRSGYHRAVVASVALEERGQVEAVDEAICPVDIAGDGQQPGIEEGPHVGPGGEPGDGDDELPGLLVVPPKDLPWQPDQVVDHLGM